MSECDCKRKGHNPGELKVGDWVCVYCSEFACADLTLPAFGPDGVKLFGVKGKPEGCAG